MFHLKGKVLSSGRENPSEAALPLPPGSLSRWWDIPKDFAALYQSKLVKVEFIFHLGWILCQFPVRNSTNVDLFHVSQQGTSFLPFFSPEMNPCSEFSWSRAKSTSVLYFQSIHEWFLLGFFSCFDSSLQSLEIQNIWIKILCSYAMLVVNFARFGKKPHHHSKYKFL